MKNKHLKTKEWKKWLSAILCPVMIMGCLVGCAGEEPAGEEKTPDTSVAESSSGATTESKPVTEEPELDLGALPFTNEDVTITIGVSKSATVEDYDNNAYTLWLEEQTGINLEFVFFPSDKAECMTQLSLMMSGGEKLPDILMCLKGLDADKSFEFGNDGYFIDLMPYYDKYGYYTKQFFEQTLEADRSLIFGLGTDPKSGALYAFPNYGPNTINGTATIAMINGKFLEAVGAEIPTTVDELYDVLVKFRDEDPNGNGIADEIAAIGQYSGYRADITQYIINAFVYCSDDYLWNVTDGKLWSPYRTDEYREALIYLNKLCKEDLLPSMTFTLTDSDLMGFATPADQQSIVGLLGGHPLVCFESNNEAMYDYVAIPFLEGATELGGYTPYQASFYAYNTAITADCENPDLAFRLIDLIGSFESKARQRYGEYGIDWVDADEGAVDTYGRPANIKSLNPTVYNDLNSKSWHQDIPVIQPADDVMRVQVELEDESWGTKRSLLQRAVWKSFSDRPAAKETFTQVVYTSDENAVVSELNTLYKDYVREARSLFVSGALDPNKDSDWQKYLSELDALGEATLLENAQAAYDRIK